jgi:RNA polymerase sigma-70 factor (ECF subfamily)
MEAVIEISTQAQASEGGAVSARDREAEALAALAAAYRPVIRDWCRRWVADPDDAEDLASDALLRAARHFAGFRPARPGAVRGWLFRIALNLCRDHQRRQQRAAVCADTECLEAPGPSTEDGLVWLVVEDLSEPLRAAVLLRMRYELPYAEIARILRCRVGTARWRVHEGLRRLGEMMSDE